MNVAAPQDVSAFKRRVDVVVRQIRPDRRAAGIDRLYAPGEIEHGTDLRYRQVGIPLTAAILDDLAESARLLGVPIDALG